MINTLNYGEYVHTYFMDQKKYFQKALYHKLIKYKNGLQYIKVGNTYVTCQALKLNHHQTNHVYIRDSKTPHTSVFEG